MNRRSLLFKSFCSLAGIVAFVGACTEQRNRRPQQQRLSSGKELWTKRHPRVEAWVRKYRKNKVPQILWETKAPKYIHYIKRVFQDYGIPIEVCLLPMVESGFDPKARTKRAYGMWQFIEGTAKEMGLKVSMFRDERADWKKSTHAAAKYLSQLNRQFDGDWALTLAAYNGGPGYIKRSMQKQGQRDYWKLKLKDETMNYVPKLVAMVQILQNKSS